MTQIDAPASTMPPELSALRLVTVWVDGETTLISLKLRCILSNDVSDCGQFDEFVPHVQLYERLEREIWAANGRTIKKGEACDFPGWDLVMNYIEQHPELTMDRPIEARIAALEESRKTTEDLRNNADTTAEFEHQTDRLYEINNEIEDLKKRL